MRTHARAIKAHEVTHPDWETVKSWAKATFTKERITDLVVCASTVTVLGTVLFTLYRAMENQTVAGF